MAEPRTRVGEVCRPLMFLKFLVEYDVCGVGRIYDDIHVFIHTDFVDGSFCFLIDGDVATEGCIISRQFILVSRYLTVVQTVIQGCIGF